MDYIFPTIPQRKLKENKNHIYEDLHEPKIVNIYNKLNLDVAKSETRHEPLTPRNKYASGLKKINRRKIILIFCLSGFLLIVGLIVLVLFLTSNFFNSA